MKILFVVFTISSTIVASPIEVATHIPTTVTSVLQNTNGSRIQFLLKNSRRIIGGKESFNNRPYMVYLKLPTNNQKYQAYRSWLCGGVIIHEEYVLTSAACIEDTKYFYVVSGTYTYVVRDKSCTLNQKHFLLSYEIQILHIGCVPMTMHSNEKHDRDRLPGLTPDKGTLPQSTTQTRNFVYSFNFYSWFCYHDMGNPESDDEARRHDEQDQRKSNICLKNAAKRAVWKCIPRNYVFDNQDNDNLKWMSNDIAIVKVEDEFDFERRVRGCDFIPKPIAYNNQSDKLEEPGTLAAVAGWGTTSSYGEWVNTRRQNTKHPLMDSPVIVISKKRCKNRWGPRYFNIIDNYMICTRDYVPDMTEICSEKYTECTDIMFSGEEQEYRREGGDAEFVHSANHNYTVNRRSGIYSSGGFCENDHGGPLVYGEGVNAVVIGVISACLVKERTNKCYGPFLYTSVYKNRFLINCSVFKSMTSNCEKLFRADGTHIEETISWKDHPDGPSKAEIKENRRREQEMLKNASETVTANNNSNVPDKEANLKHSGAVLGKDLNLKNVTSTTEIVLNATTENIVATTNSE